ncbi:hypothetical protein MTR67_043898 [Solanum verrucosum]|uniref:Uncharacterized protein n=1 Tax=Solanum verrucosum TaxID=315347 RepID=A0AAF0UPK4_SOLVR|nr:hypothetical protein MTR67_043898 [Solanum verrucosum]
MLYPQAVLATGWMHVNEHGQMCGPYINGFVLGQTNMYTGEPVSTRHWCGCGCVVRVGFGQSDPDTLTRAEKKIWGKRDQFPATSSERRRSCKKLEKTTTTKGEGSIEQHTEGINLEKQLEIYTAQDNQNDLQFMKEMGQCKEPVDKDGVLAQPYTEKGREDNDEEDRKRNTTTTPPITEAKKNKHALSKWRKEKFRDIFTQLAIREEIARVKKDFFEECPSPENRAILKQAQAELKLYIHYEEEYWRQKERVQWLEEGDRNTRFHHCLVKGRRKKLISNRMMKADGSWFVGDKQLAEEAMNFFKDQLTWVY